MTTPPTVVMLHGDEATDLARLLGEVEDWLLHADPLVLADLDRFRGPPVLGRERTADVIEQLGRYSCLIGRRRRGEERA
jgi:hypothetical protein